ncbi:MAG: TlpA family protein disulfide reductase [Planctomycetota bacterium]|jgi:thiol-disulfide isomerase/thioredoxin
MRVFFHTVIIIIAGALALGENPNKETTPVIVEKETQSAVKKPIEKPIEYADSGIGMKAPALAGMNWIKGKPVKIAPGRAYVIEFWATWCPPCKASIPHLTEIQKQYKDKLTVIGVSSEAASIVQPFVDQMGSKMNYTVIADSQGTARRNYSQAFGQGGIPHAFIIDPKGRVAWVGHPMDGMDEILKKVMDGDYDPIAEMKLKTEREALEKQLLQWYGQYFKTIQTQGISKENTQIATMFIEKAHPQALNALAWNIMTLPEKEKRQLDLALKAAEQSNKLTNGKEPAVLDIYAMALFENGKIAEAIEHQTKAVELAASNPPMQAELKKALAKYKEALKTK